MGGPPQVTVIRTRAISTLPSFSHNNHRGINCQRASSTAHWGHWGCRGRSRQLRECLARLPGHATPVRGGKGLPSFRKGREGRRPAPFSRPTTPCPSAGYTPPSPEKPAKQPVTPPQATSSAITSMSQIVRGNEFSRGMGPPLSGRSFSWGRHKTCRLHQPGQPACHTTVPLQY